MLNVQEVRLASLAPQAPRLARDSPQHQTDALPGCPGTWAIDAASCGRRLHCFPCTVLACAIGSSP